MAQRKTVEDTLLTMLQDGGPNGTQLGPPPHCEPEYLALTAQVHDLNVAMFETLLEAKELSARAPYVKGSSN